MDCITQAKQLLIEKSSYFYPEVSCFVRNKLRLMDCKKANASQVYDSRLESARRSKVYTLCSTVLYVRVNSFSEQFQGKVDQKA